MGSSAYYAYYEGIRTSGRLTPSAEDEDITTRLKAAGELLGITLLDHLIFTDQGYYSFLQSGKLN
jgi:DNA repair protein RadC